MSSSNNSLQLHNFCSQIACRMQTYGPVKCTFRTSDEMFSTRYYCDIEHHSRIVVCCSAEHMYLYIKCNNRLFALIEMISTKSPAMVLVSLRSNGPLRCACLLIKDLMLGRESLLVSRFVLCRAKLQSVIDILILGAMAPISHTRFLSAHKLV